MKSDVRTISGRILVSVHMFVCKDENVKFFNLQDYCMNYTNSRITRRREERDIPDYEGFICKEKLDTQICLGCSAHAHCTVFSGGSYLQRRLTLQP